MAQFELGFLPDYSNEALLEEVRRVAELVERPILTQADFSRYAKVSVCTLQRRFHGWKGTLHAAGLGHRYKAKLISDKEILDRIRTMAERRQSSFFSAEEFSSETGCCRTTINRRFGSWEAALDEAGVELTDKGKRYTQVQCFENLYNVWLHYGRQPYVNEMSRLPSKIGHGAYVSRWGTWRKALIAFVEWANSDTSSAEAANGRSGPDADLKPVADRREIPLGLRFRVFARDSFRCVACGASPAITLGVDLHVDHIIPFNPLPGAPKGKTVIENLQTLCKECNLGKGNRQF